MPSITGLPPTSVGVAVACAVLTAATKRLDAMRLEAERELAEHVRSRHEIEALIERLIERLDGDDAGDEGDPLDVGELDALDAPDFRTPETYGRGFGPCAPAATAKDRLFAKGRARA